jgi:hypothetical protein
MSVAVLWFRDFQSTEHNTILVAAFAVSLVACSCGLIGFIGFIGFITSFLSKNGPSRKTEVVSEKIPGEPE